jgi:hypothetical protein
MTRIVILKSTSKEQNEIERTDISKQFVFCNEFTVHVTKDYHQDGELVLE